MGTLATVKVAILLTVFVCGLADPAPDADPAALPELWGGAGMPSMMSANTLSAPITSKWGGMIAVGPSAFGVGNCGMVDKCCRMADMGCCMEQGQQCFTKWEQQCRFANKPLCEKQMRPFCADYQTKKCNFIKKLDSIEVPVDKCTPKIETKCFRYPGQSCKPTTKPVNATFNWTNEKLSVGVTKNIKKCHKVKTCKMNTHTKRNKIPTKELECEDVGNYTTYRTEYRQQCYQLPKQVCNKKTRNCGMTMETVCQQVPIRVPGPPQPRQVCKLVDKVEYGDKFNVTTCIPGLEEKCVEFEVLEQTVEKEPMSESIGLPSAECVLEESEKVHCAMVPTQLDCRKTTERRKVWIYQRVCNETGKKTQCKNLPVSNCINNPGQECTMVPREVCQPTCLKSTYCDRCAQFARSGGFSQCSSKTCPNFYSPAANCRQGGSCY